MRPDPELKREAIHNVFWGVNRDDYEHIDSTLTGYAQKHLDAGHQEGHLEGFLLGIAVGALLGVFTSGLIYVLV